MSEEDYKKLSQCLDVIQNELNKVAAAVGHVSFEEFTAKNRIKQLEAELEEERQENASLRSGDE